MSNISASAVTIRLFGLELKPEYVTQLLGCMPSSAAKTGEKLIKPNGKERIVKRGFWLLESDENDETSVEEKIKLLLARVTDNPESWQDVVRNLDIADISCGLFIDNWHEGFALSPFILRKVADRHLEISFHIYSPTDTWYDKDEESKTSDESA